MKADGYLDYLNNRWFFLTDPNGKDVYDSLPDLGGRKVAAVTENAYTPLNFVDPATGKAVGWEYDAVNEICRRLNCVVDWQVTSWDAMIAAVKEGQFDVGMDGITINDERKQQVDFSIPYMTSQQFMLVRADENRFTTPEEFAADPKLLIGSQAGTTNFYTAVYNVLDGDEANPRIKLFENFGASVQALHRRRRGHGPDGCRLRPRLHRRQPRQAQDRRRPHRHRRLRLHLHPRAPTWSHPSTPPSRR